MEGGPAAVVLLAGSGVDLLAEDDVVVVEEDVAPLTLVAVEEHLARRHQSALAAALRRGNLEKEYGE